MNFDMSVVKCFLIILVIMVSPSLMAMGCVRHNVLLAVIGYIGVATSNLLSCKGLADIYCNKNNK